MFKIRKLLFFLYTNGLLFSKIYFKLLYNMNFTISFMFSLIHRYVELKIQWLGIFILKCYAVITGALNEIISKLPLHTS